MLLRFPSIPSNQVSAESGRGNFTDFWATQYDRQSIWSNFKEIESPTDLYSLPGIFIKFKWQVRICRGDYGVFLRALKNICSHVTLTNNKLVEFWLRPSTAEQ